MTIKLTDDLRAALQEQPGQPIRVEDDQTRQVYVLLTEEDYRRLLDDELRRALRVGLDQSDQGVSQPWNVEAFLTEAHRKHEG